MALMDATITIFQNMKKNANFATSQVLERFALMVLNRSQYYVPVATGSLKLSGDIIRDNDLTFRVVYGQGVSVRGNLRNPYYAAYVHEINYKHESPTQWKYLEQAVIDMWPKMIEVAGPVWRQFSGVTYGVIGDSGRTGAGRDSGPGWDNP